MQASRIACVSATVRIRGSFFGAFSVIARPRYGFALGHVVQERLPAAPPAGPPRGQQVADPGAVAGLVRIERAHRGELAVHRRGGDLGVADGSTATSPAPARRRKLQPDDELADVLQPGLAPVQAAEAEEATSNP